MFSNNEGHHDQLVMKAPRKLKEDVRKNFPYTFLGKKVNKNKFEGASVTKPQTTVAGTKHTFTTGKNEIIHRKRVNKTLKSTVQNPKSRRGKHRRGPDGWFTLVTLNQPETTTNAEQPLRASTPILEKSMLETTLQSPTEVSPAYSAGKSKLIRNKFEQKSR